MAREDGFFDDLARGLADGSLTRGKALKLMSAAVVGGTLGSLGLGGVAVADEECKPTAKKCKKDKQCCSGACVGGTCAACPSEQVLCGGSCVSNSCLTNSGQVFNTTTCQCECPSGTVELSNGTCVTSCAGGGACPGCEGCAQGISDTYCFNLSGSQGSCATDSDCPTGEFCASGASGSCQTACTPTQT
jgi:CXCXC repeat